MLTRYSIEYSTGFRRHHPSPHQQFYTDDPLECEQFIQDLLERGMALHTIRHDGAELPRNEFDRLVKLAAAAGASHRICTSLGIKPDEERHRFGFAA
jgi:hypothetical protein